PPTSNRRRPVLRSRLPGRISPGFGNPNKPTFGTRGRMKRIVTILGWVCLTAAQASVGFADSNSANFPGCGTVMNRNSSQQFGPFNWLEYIVETQGSVDFCGQYVVTAA